jgi:hypothetical protein
MRIEQPQPLPAIDRVERVVDVERDPFGNPLEGLSTPCVSRCPPNPIRERQRVPTL